MGYGVITGQVTGTTTAAYVVALTWDTDGLKNKSIHIVNTHATLTMKFKLLGRYNTAQTAGKEDVLVAETTLGVGEDARLQFDKQYFQQIVSVINGSGAATFEINYSGLGE